MDLLQSPGAGGGGGGGGRGTEGVACLVSNILPVGVRIDIETKLLMK